MISVFYKSKVRVIRDGVTQSIPVAELNEREQVYDTYGKVHGITVDKTPVEERAFLLTLAHGEPFVLGEKNELLCRQMDSARWRRKKMVEVDRPHFVRLPQKKVYAPQGLFDLLDADEKGMYLKPDKASEMLDTMEKAASCGLLVQRDKTSLRIDIEKRRPSCFAAKLLTGNFNVALEQSLDGLCAKGIVSPCMPFDDALISNVKKTGVIFEGNNIFNEVPILDIKLLDGTALVCHIQPDNFLTPIELAWCMT